MKYFTPELWASWQEVGHKPPPPAEDPFQLCRLELDGLRGRIAEAAFHFFSEADVHDGQLLECTLSEREQERGDARPHYPVIARLRVASSSRNCPTTETPRAGMSCLTLLPVFLDRLQRLD